MKSILAFVLIGISMSACVTGSGTGTNRAGVARLSEEEKHRLYSAALAASESPLDTDLFKDVCKRIGIFDAAGKPNDKYMAFVTEHVNWGMKAQTDQFRQEINSKEKAREYIRNHLPR